MLRFAVFVRCATLPFAMIIMLCAQGQKHKKEVQKDGGASSRTRCQDDHRNPMRTVRFSALLCTKNSELLKLMARPRVERGRPVYPSRVMKLFAQGHKTDKKQPLEPPVMAGPRVERVERKKRRKRSMAGPRVERGRRSLQVSTVQARLRSYGAESQLPPYQPFRKNTTRTQNGKKNALIHVWRGLESNEYPLFKLGYVRAVNLLRFLDAWQRRTKTQSGTRYPRVERVGGYNVFGVEPNRRDALCRLAQAAQEIAARRSHDPLSAQLWRSLESNEGTKPNDFFSVACQWLHTNRRESEARPTQINDSLSFAWCGIPFFPPRKIKNLERKNGGKT
ncbi:hypothetical protein B0H16DRAFT_1472247 [Mycena metata]|uniref:Uncharacterized protein n=1 Tax=Mycena metata TaxID=1033252 RepID=A0AAD7MMP0_9AGAR|nr:hypothetical protein B0H16DRAFT_1472247 [Mycena metata]